MPSKLPASFVTLLVAFASLPCLSTVAAQELALTKAEVDVEASRSYRDGARAGGIDEERLHRVLGLLPREREDKWSLGEISWEKPAVCQYVFVFKQPVEFGSLFALTSGQQVSVLKPGASVDAAPQDQAWVPLESPAPQLGGQTFTFAKPIRTQAVLVVDRRNHGPTHVSCLRLWKARVQNVTPAALGYASREYYRKPQDFVPPHLFAAALVPAGTGVWQNVGEEKGRIFAAPVSDLNAEWFLLAWDRPQTISGLWLASTAKNCSFEYYAGPDAVNPRAGTTDEWKKVREPVEQMHHGRWVRFNPPVSTRGLRVNITKVEGRGPQIAEISGYHVFTDLGDRPLEVARSRGPASDIPPFEIPYQLKDAGNLTLVVNDSSGKRVRNVIARTPAKAGPGVAGWDLRDENGQFVPPGEYRWSAVAVPQLQPKYEFTVYPNVNENAPNNAAWFTGTSGSGGWLADHCNNSAVCAVGERVFLGAFMAESGVALIECDLAGRKRWGHQGFAAWTGVGLLASDGKQLFNATQVESTDRIWSVDVETRQVKDVFAAAATAERKRGMQGLAARDGKLYFSISAPTNWLSNAFAASDVDLPHCYPLYGPPRHSKNNEVVPDPRNDFLRLFRLTETPPGSAAQGSLVYLQSQADSGKRQHIVLAFKKPAPIGSLVLPRPEGADVALKVSLLKADAPYPPRTNHAADWTDLAVQPSADWDVVAAPPGATTRAVRFTFTRGGEASSDDLLAGLDKEPEKTLDLDKAAPAAEDPAAKLLGEPLSAGRWLARLEGAKILRARFKNLSSQAQVRFNSGEVGKDGSWDAKRTRALTPSDPGIYVHQWKSAQKVRGLAIKEIEGKRTRIDVYTGPAGEIDIASDQGWEQVAEYEQGRRNYYHPSATQNHDSRYLDGYVDFGRTVETRAVRLRIVEQWADNGSQGLEGVRNDHGGQQLSASRCRVYGLAAVEYLGEELPRDKKTEQRIDVIDVATGKVEREIDIDQPGRVAFNPQGELFAVSGKNVVEVDRQGSKHRVVISDLLQPGDLTFDASGNLYVVDLAPERQNIRVYSDSGSYLRSIGKAGGGRIAGAWDPERLTSVIDIDVDQDGQVWAVENQYYPKRITLWGADGKFKREFLGNTQYGGGGVLDPYDKSRLFYGPMEFELDWKTGRSRLKNLTWVGVGPAGEIPIQAQGRTYLVTRNHTSTQCGVVYRYEKDQLKLAAAVGQAVGFEPLRPAEMVARLGGVSLENYKFIWCDRNGNAEVDAEEVELTPKPEGMRHVGAFDRDLGVQFGALRYRVKEILAHGAPVYEEHPYPKPLNGHYVQKLETGGFHMIGTDGAPEAGLTDDGKLRWTYPSYGAGGHALYKPARWARDQVVSELGFIGHEQGHADLGEFVVMHANTGGWNLWTADGLLLGTIFRDYRDPESRPWSMKEHERGRVLTDVSLGQEHFQGYFCRSLADGKYYAVAGHNHISVVEVVGLDQARRYQGTIVVTAEDLKKAQEWQVREQLVSVYQRAPVMDVYRLSSPPKIDGRWDDWGETTSAQIEERGKFAVGFDDTHLYVAFAIDQGPLKNTGMQWDRLFKTGASVDLQIGVDPRAPIDRSTPGVGDQRVLLTWMEGKPIAVQYRSVLAGGPKSEPWRVVSPVGAVSFDEVRRMDEVQLARTEDGASGGYRVEAAIPLKSLGLKPAHDLRLKLDWGFLRTGPDGHEVLERVYWSNKATGIVADAPSEAALHPDLWGFARFHDRKKASAEDLLPESPTDKKGKKGKEEVDELLDLLKEPKK